MPGFYIQYLVATGLTLPLTFSFLLFPGERGKKGGSRLLLFCALDWTGEERRSWGVGIGMGWSGMDRDGGMERWGSREPGNGGEEGLTWGGKKRRDDGTRGVWMWLFFSPPEKNYLALFMKTQPQVSSLILTSYSNILILPQKPLYISPSSLSFLTFPIFKQKDPIPSSSEYSPLPSMPPKKAHHKAPQRSPSIFTSTCTSKSTSITAKTTATTTTKIPTSPHPHTHPPSSTPPTSYTRTPSSNHSL
jgi:hypothetical protein